MEVLAFYQKLSYTKKFIVNLSVSLAIIGSLFLLLFLLSRDIRVRTNNTLVYKQTIFQTSELLENFRALSAEKQQYGSYISFAHNVFPDESGLVFLPQNIAQLAQTNSVNATFAFRGKGEGQYMFIMTVDGKISNIMHFLDDIAKWRYVIKINTLDFALQSQSELRYRARIEGNAFYKK